MAYGINCAPGTILTSASDEISKCGCPMVAIRIGFSTTHVIRCNLRPCSPRLQPSSVKIISHENYLLRGADQPQRERYSTPTFCLTGIRSFQPSHASKAALRADWLSSSPCSASPACYPSSQSCDSSRRPIRADTDVLLFRASPLVPSLVLPLTISMSSLPSPLSRRNTSATNGVRSLTC